MLEKLVYPLFAVLVLGALVYLLICVDPNAKGVLGAVRKLVLERLPRGLRWAGDRIFGPRFGSCLDGTCRYVFKTNNPIVLVG